MRISKYVLLLVCAGLCGFMIQPFHARASVSGAISAIPSNTILASISTLDSFTEGINVVNNAALSLGKGFIGSLTSTSNNVTGVASTSEASVWTVAHELFSSFFGTSKNSTN